MKILVIIHSAITLVTAALGTIALIAAFMGADALLPHSSHARCPDMGRHQVN